METKNSIRKKILTVRNQISIEEQLKKSKLINEQTLNLDAVQKAEFILCYAGYKSEVLTNVLTQALLDTGKKVYFPKVFKDEMEFYRIYNYNDLIEGFMNIPEPGEHCKELFSAHLLASSPKQVVMIIPGCVFSEKGERIGYGKGYYDRYLMRVPCTERIALCYELQILDEIPTDVHDIPMTKIVTEKRIIYI